MTVCYYIYKMSHLVSSVIFQEENVSRSNLSQSSRFVSLNDHLKSGTGSFLKGKLPVLGMLFHAVVEQYCITLKGTRCTG